MRHHLTQPACQPGMMDVPALVSLPENAPQPSAPARGLCHGRLRPIRRTEPGSYAAPAPKPASGHLPRLGATPGRGTCRAWRRLQDGATAVRGASAMSGASTARQRPDVGAPTARVGGARGAGAGRADCDGGPAAPLGRPAGSAAPPAAGWGSRRRRVFERRSVLELAAQNQQSRVLTFVERKRSSRIRTTTEAVRHIVIGWSRTISGCTGGCGTGWLGGVGGVHVSLLLLSPSIDQASESGAGPRVSVLVASRPGRAATRLSPSRSWLAARVGSDTWTTAAAGSKTA
jgi:hypothetical protein